MSRLVVNPNTAQAWEIQLKPGENSLGRGDVNDFKIQDLSVSSTHCRIVVNGSSALIRDLNSTNGTFLNQQSVQEAPLQNGSLIRLGNVQLMFHSDAAAAPPPIPVAPPPARPGSLRVSSPANVAGTAPPPATVAAPRPQAPQPIGAVNKKARAKSDKFSLPLGIAGALVGAAAGVGAMYGFYIWTEFRFPLLGIGIGVLTGLGARLLGRGGDNTLGIISGSVALLSVGATLYLMYGTVPVLNIISMIISVSVAYRIASG